MMTFLRFAVVALDYVYLLALQILTEMALQMGLTSPTYWGISVLPVMMFFALQMLISMVSRMEMTFQFS